MAWAPKFARNNDELVRLFNENMRGIESELARRPQASTTETKIRTLPIASPIVGLQLGETSTTAYRGDRGKIAYDHSQATGNPHGTTAADVGAAAASHAAQHGASGSDPITIQTSQISNVSAFMRTVLDDASAADARTTLGAAQSTATLADSAASTALPTAGTATALGTLLQQIRNNLKGIIGDFVSKSTARLQTVVSGVLFKGGFYSERSSNIFNLIESKVAGDTYNRFETRSNGSMFWGDGTTSIFESLFRPALGILRTNSNFQVLSLDKNGGSDTTALTGNVQTQLNGKVGKTGDEMIAGSKIFTAIPTVPNQPPESVGGGAANAQFVADKTYPGYQGADITADGSITPVHAELRKVNADNLILTITNTPVIGTVSWLYFTPIGCTAKSLTLSFTDVLGTARTYQKSAVPGSVHLPHLIKLVRALDGWIVEWETEA